MVRAVYRVGSSCRPAPGSGRPPAVDPGPRPRLRTRGRPLRTRIRHATRSSANPTWASVAPITNRGRQAPSVRTQAKPAAKSSTTPAIRRRSPRLNSPITSTSPGRRSPRQTIYAYSVVYGSGAPQFKTHLPSFSYRQGPGWGGNGRDGGWVEVSTRGMAMSITIPGPDEMPKARLLPPAGRVGRPTRTARRRGWSPTGRGRSPGRTEEHARPGLTLLRWVTTPPASRSSAFRGPAHRPHQLPALWQVIPGQRSRNTRRLDDRAGRSPSRVLRPPCADHARRRGPDSLSQSRLTHISESVRDQGQGQEPEH
jgi:hypothetical protein